MLIHLCFINVLYYWYIIIDLHVSLFLKRLRICNTIWPTAGHGKLLSWFHPKVDDTWVLQLLIWWMENNIIFFYFYHPLCIFIGHILVEELSPLPVTPQILCQKVRKYVKSDGEMSRGHPEASWKRLSLATLGKI